MTKLRCFDYLDMAASLAVPINPDLLVWAREAAGYSVEAAAGKLGIKAEKLDAVEKGEPAPSYALLKKAADIYKRPLHPYTQGLMRARPGGSTQKQRLSVIPGIVPAATQFKDNCRFNPRCPMRTDVCVEKEPPLVEYGGNHCAACWHTKSDGIDAWGQQAGAAAANAAGQAK